MGQQQSLSQKIHIAICNNEKSSLEGLISSPEFNAEVIDTKMFVELVDKQWDNSIIIRLAKHAGDEQLASLVATVLLYGYRMPLAEIFILMKNPTATIEKHYLKELFLTACDRENVDAVRDMIQYSCFDPSDERPVVVVFRKAMTKHNCVNDELLDAVLSSCPHHKEAAKYLLSLLPKECKQEKVREALKAKLENYLSSS